MEFEKILLFFIIFALIFSLIVLLIFFIDLILSLVKNLKIKRCSKTTHEVIENEVVEKQAQDGIDGQEADILLWRGKRYKVINCEEWQSNVISHFKMVSWEVGAYGQ
jgi:hypothetical protein